MKMFKISPKPSESISPSEPPLNKNRNSRGNKIFIFFSTLHQEENKHPTNQHW